MYRIKALQGIECRVNMELHCYCSLTEDYAILEAQKSRVNLVGPITFAVLIFW